MPGYRRSNPSDSRGSTRRGVPIARIIGVEDTIEDRRTIIEWAKTARRGFNLVLVKLMPGVALEAVRSRTAAGFVVALQMGKSGSV